MKISTVRLCLLIVLLLSGALAADQTLNIFFNGNKSNLKPVKVGDTLCVPVHFPLLEGESEYKVTVGRSGDKVEIRQIPMRPKKRGDDPCYHCTGTGLCQNDYPVGTGNTTSGQTCPMCNGAGKCWYCTGSGKAWK